MLALLPLLFGFFSSLTIRRYCADWRVAVLCAAVITATVLTAVTEFLSLRQALSFYPLLMIWSFLTLGAAWKAWQGFEEKSRDRHHFYSKDKKSSVCPYFLLIVFILGVTAITAAVGTPNTWDSMTYHLSRVEHWIENRTVAFYPTNILRQLYSSPWAEFAIVNLRILGGGETSANFVQWAAMAGSLITVALIAGQLGASRIGQLTAAAITACLPMGILQAVSTQTDYVAAFWLAVFVFFLIASKNHFSFINVIGAGASLGLAFLTKGYSYIFAIPFLVWYLMVHSKPFSSRHIRGCVLILLCATALNVGQCLRNTQAFGSPAWTDRPLLNESFGFNVLTANMLHNMELHVFPQAVLGAQTAKIMWLDEDYAGNFLHTVLFIVIVCLALFCAELRRTTAFYITSVLSAFVLFCWVVRFEPWHSRFHLPLFILLAPTAGVVLEHYLKQKSFVILIVLGLGTLPWLFFNDQHPWFSRTNIWNVPKLTQHFYKHADLVDPYFRTANYLRSIGCRQIALRTGDDNWEYPWWALLAGPDLRIEHIGVNNPSANLKYPLGDFQPCAQIVSGAGSSFSVYLRKKMSG
jgi:hypothetical protein